MFLEIMRSRHEIKVISCLLFERFLYCGTVILEDAEAPVVIICSGETFSLLIFFVSGNNVVFFVVG